MNEAAADTSTRMVRAAVLADRAGMLGVIAATKLFREDELGEMEQMLDTYLEGTAGDEQFWAVAFASGTPAGVAYYAQERMTSGTWNLYFIGVDPRVQGKGYGRALVCFVEEALAARGERLLLVETSGLATFEATRTFYRKCGYEEEARVREFYRAGEDKIIFRKLLPKGK